MIQPFKKGFTLIELLVVIAIIGILSAVVLASLTTARTKGQDAAIKKSLQSARAQAELFYNNGYTYDNVCTSGTNNIAAIMTGTGKILSATQTTGGDAQVFVYNATGGVGAAVCHDTTAGFAAMVSLKGETNRGWCIDSTGAATSTTVLSGSSVVCGT